MPVQRSAPHPHHRDNPRYFLRRQMDIDGKFRLPGEEVPEAASWPNLFAYLDLGWIEVVDEAEDEGPTLGTSRPLKEAIAAPVPEETSPEEIPHPPIPEVGGITGPIDDSPTQKPSEKPMGETRGKKGAK